MSAPVRPRIGILADDLTSAADGAGPFVGRGSSAVVGRGVVPAQPVDVVAVDARSRSAQVKRAASRVGQLTAQLAGCEILFKTCDSTLRGHIRAELEAAFAASGRLRMVFAPAFPDGGRITIGGVQLVDGVPVADSSNGKDPVHPVRSSRLAEFVPAGQITLLDAQSQHELDRQVAEMTDPDKILWVGSPRPGDGACASVRS